MVKQCAFFFGGQPAEGGGQFTLQAGITPSVAQLRFLLRQPLNQIGDMVLTDNQQSRRYRNCRITRSFVPEGGGGPRYREVTIQDRRWRWSDRQFAVYGQYNSTVGREVVLRRNTRDLLILCLEALGETGYDVSQVPTGFYPVVDWDASNPAAEMESLCQELGLLVVLRQNDTIRIVRDGVGVIPRADPRQMDFEQAIEPPVIPRYLVYEGGKTTIQHDLNLVPVGLEDDSNHPNYGKFVPINELSYTPDPDFGWRREDPATFPNVRQASRQTALKHVWRTYAVGGRIPLPVPSRALNAAINQGKLTQNQQAAERNYFTIDRGTHWRVLPLNDFQLTLNPEFSLSLGLTEKGIPPVVIGYFYQHNLANTNTGGFTDWEFVSQFPNVADLSQLIATRPYRAGNTAEIYKKAKTVDYVNGRVDFQEPVFFKDMSVAGQTDYYPALLRLRTSFSLRDGFTGQFLCQQFWQPVQFPGATNVVKMIKNSSSFYVYDTSGTDNEFTFIQQAIAGIAGELQSYEFLQGFSSPYKGFIFDIDVDGICKTIQFDSATNGPGTTYIDFGMESPERYLTLQELRNQRLATFVGFKRQEEARKIARQN